MSNYIVTGGAGFIGSNLVKELVRNKHKVYVIDDLSTGFERNMPSEAIFYKTDLSKWECVKDLTFGEKIDAVFHLAAQSSGEVSFDNPSYDIDANYKATYHALKLCEKTLCKRFVFASSMSVYGAVSEGVSETEVCNPISYYGLNKLASEHLIRIFCKNSGIKPTCLRLFNVYGQGQNMSNLKQGMVSIYLSYLMRNEKIHVKGSLNRFRDFVVVDEVVEAFLRVMDNKHTFFENINLGTGKKTTVQELLEAILEGYQKNDFLAWVKSEGNTAGDIKGCVADTKKLEKILQWKPKIDIAEGIGQMKTWLDQTKDWWN